MITTPDWHPTPEGVAFTGLIGHPLPDFPLEGDDTPPPLRLLEELWGRNLLDHGGESATLPWLVVYELERHELALLGLPEPDQGFHAKVKTDRWLSARDFRIWMEIEHGGHRNATSEADRTGLVFSLLDGPALPPQAVGRLILLLDQPLPRSPDERSVLIAEIKKLAAGSSAITLDAYLRNEEYIVPKGMGVDVISASVDEIALRATANGVNDDDFLGFVEGPTRTVYTQFLPEGKRRRLVLRPSQREALDQLKRSGTLTDADVPAFLDNPEAFLPDEVEVDLAEFSTRVRGLVPVVYRSQPYISVQPRDKQRGWFEAVPGVRVSSGSSARNNPDTEITRDEFKKLVEESKESGQRYVKYRDGWIEIDSDAANRFDEAIDKLPPPDKDGKRVIDEDGCQFVLDVISNVDRLDYLPPDSNPTVASSPSAFIRDYDVPQSLRATLYDHQRVGYNWMRHLHDSRWGGLLADDMGLGKTVQIIALMSHLHEIGELRPALVVVPVAVITNWQRELRRFAPGIRPAHEHRGAGREKDPRRLARHEIVITSYATLRRDQLMLGRIDWSVIACDEAQNVKNPTAGVTSAVKGMKARFRLACTGTPVENGLSELWCIVDFAQPGRLGSQTEFRREFERPLVSAAESGTDASALVDSLRNRLNPHYIRRTKDEHLDLPPKESRTYEVSMSQAQVSLYGKELSGVKEGSINALAALQRLIAICSHPLALKGKIPETGPGRLLVDSPKLRRTLEIVAEIRELREKVVIYTRFRAMQRILQTVLRHRFRLEPRVLNGLVTGHNRHRIVDDFNQRPGFDAMILSPEAAGVGLNITGATHVIHYTRLWNPARENQATDRVHRIGQERPVSVHYPVVVGEGFKSVEQHLDDLLSEKLELARNVLAPRAALDVTGELERRVTGATSGIRAERLQRQVNNFPFAL